MRSPFRGHACPALQGRWSAARRSAVTQKRGRSLLPRHDRSDSLSCRLVSLPPVLGGRRLALLGWTAGGEEVGEQLRHTFCLVVMDQMRGVGQALDTVEVGHVVAVGLC